MSSLVHYKKVPNMFLLEEWKTLIQLYNLVECYSKNHSKIRLILVNSMSGLGLGRSEYIKFMTFADRESCL